jgi:hypothetical protein
MVLSLPTNRLCIPIAVAILGLVIPACNQRSRKVHPTALTYTIPDGFVRRDFRKPVVDPPVAPPCSLSSLVGTYSFGGCTAESSTLRIEVNGLFAMDAHVGCGAPRQHLTGKARIDNGYLVLETSEVVEEAFKIFNIFPNAFLPVTWGERHYLISRDRLLEFCNSVNGGLIPDVRWRDFGVYLRDGDQKKKAAGPPPLPKECSPYLLAKPQHGKITSLIDAYTAVVDIGHERGLRAGMELYTDFPMNFEKNVEVIIVDVHDNDCIVQVKYPSFLERPLKVDNLVHSQLCSEPRDGE